MFLRDRLVERPSQMISVCLWRLIRSVEELGTLLPSGRKAKNRLAKQPSQVIGVYEDSSEVLRSLRHYLRGAEPRTSHHAWRDRERRGKRKSLDDLLWNGDEAPSSQPDQHWNCSRSGNAGGEKNTLWETGLIDWLMFAYIALFSALLSRLTTLACGSTWVTRDGAHMDFSGRLNTILNSTEVSGSL